MPAYPCIKCGSPVDTGGEGRCKKCQEQRPFKCTKCERQMGVLSVYAPEKLTFRKPIYCQECGPSADMVECRQCGVSLTRGNGVEVTVRGVPAVYHPECYAKQTRIHKIVLPIAIVAMVVIGGYGGYMMTHGWVTALIGAGLGVFVGLGIAKPFAPH